MSLSKEPTFTERFLLGLFGGFLGAVIGFLAGWYVEEYVLQFVAVAATVCCVAAFFLGEKIINWLVEIIRWDI